MKDIMHSVTGVSQISENVPRAVFNNFARNAIVPNGLSGNDEASIYMSMKWNLSLYE